MSRRWDKSKPPSGPFALNRDCPQAVGLVAWWPMGGASGPKLVVDEAGRSHLAGTASPMTLGPTGAPTCVFNGSSDVLTAAAAPVTAMPLTLAGWATAGSSSLVGSILSLDAGLAAFASANFYRLVVVGSASPKQVRANQGLSGSEVQATYGAGWVAGQEFHTAGVFTSTTSRAVYYNGALGTSDTTSLAAPTVSQATLGRHSVTGSEQYWSGTLGEAGAWAVALPAHIIARLYDPGTRFELWYPLRSPRWISLGGSSWTVTLTDLASATDTYTHSVDVQATLSDSASATDTLTQSVVAAATLLDSASATDVLTAAAVVQAAITDLATATDTASATFDASGTANLTDLASATDSLTAAAVVLRSLIDTAAGTDACSAATTMVRTLTDAAAATDSYTASVPGAWTVTLTELAAAVDVIAGAFSGTEIHSAPPLLQRLQASTRAARLSATRAARTQSSTR